MEVERNIESQQSRRPRIRTSQLVHQQQDVPYQRQWSQQLPVSMPPLPPSVPTSGDWSFCVEITNDDPTRTPMKKRSKATNTKNRKSFIATLQRYSTIASWLCLIDCTLLPLMTVIIPLLGLTTTLGPERIQWLHMVGDYTTLFFLLPVGGLSTALNFYTLSRNMGSNTNRDRWRPWIIAAVGPLGWTMVAIANSYSVPGIGHLQLFHVFHRGVWHRVLNGLGCFCLLGSNQLSARQYKHATSRRGGVGEDGMTSDDSCCILHDPWNVKVMSSSQGSSARHRRRRLHPVELDV